jgi:hypothetical protein
MQLARLAIKNKRIKLGPLTGVPNYKELRKMPHPSGEHHKKAASHHEDAARSHRDAASAYNEERHETGAYYAQSAQGHSSMARRKPPTQAGSIPNNMANQARNNSGFQ